MAGRLYALPAVAAGVFAVHKAPANGIFPIGNRCCPAKIANKQFPTCQMIKVDGKLLVMLF
jgi:hypothetical protein